jgi:hypothetical protein
MYIYVHMFIKVFLFIHVDMYIYVHMFIKVLIDLHVLPYESGFGYPIGFRISTGLVLGTNFHPNRCSGRFRV